MSGDPRIEMLAMQAWSMHRLVCISNQMGHTSPAHSLDYIHSPLNVHDGPVRDLLTWVSRHPDRAESKAARDRLIVVSESWAGFGSFPIALPDTK